MASRAGPVHVVTTRRVYKDKVYCTHLLRRSYRQDGKVKNETLGNLSHLPDALIDIVRRSLQGETFVAASQAFEVVGSRAHGHVQAVALAMQRLGLASVLASTPSRERDLVLAMVASRIVQPDTKLATTRRWHCSTLAEEFGVADASEDDLYAAMDWLLTRQDAIEHKLAARHLREDALVLYDLSSSYFEGTCCPLAKRGYSRDGRPGTLQVNYGLLTDARGCPVAVSVFDGNTADSLTFLPAVQRVRERFGLAQVVMVGDRGMVSQKAIDELRGQGGVDWITALKSVSIRSLLEQGQLQLGLFDQRNLAEITSPEYPGERLVACRNDALSRLRAHKRESLLQATEALLGVIKASVDAGRLAGQDKIGVQVGKVINRHKVAKHFELSIGDASLAWRRRQDAIDAEAALDGLYVIRTSLPAKSMDAPSCVRSYKALASVERAFRSLKTVDLKVRPIHHRLANRVRAHILLCMLAFYVEWHMREAWAPLMFADTDQAAKATRDPVAPARRSASALRKAASKQIDDEQPAHSFATLMAEMATLVRNTCRAPCADAAAPTFELLTTATAHQQRAMALIQAIHP
ncbi:MAG TPA: IS1634 family transposase [Giesbergeria sp.]|nr:IS1634 family transposase [Giesbergeria sp.]